MVVDQIHLYYDMPLVSFGIDKDSNLIIQFPVFVQPYTQKPLVLYQLETGPIPILDQNIKAHSYTYLQIEKPYIPLNSETYISLRQQELRTCKRIGYEFYCEELFIVKHKLATVVKVLFTSIWKPISSKKIAISNSTLTKQILLLPFWMEVMKLF